MCTDISKPTCNLLCSLDTHHIALYYHIPCHSSPLPHLRRSLRYSYALSVCSASLARPSRHTSHIPIAFRTHPSCNLSSLSGRSIQYTTFLSSDILLVHRNCIRIPSLSDPLTRSLGSDVNNAARAPESGRRRQITRRPF